VLESVTWGGGYPHSRILLPQPDMPEPFRLHRSARFVDQRERIFCASVTAHFISRRTGDITEFQPSAVNFTTLVVMSVSSIGVVQSVIQKRKIRCDCFGPVFNLPMSTVTLVEDGLMIAMAAAAPIGKSANKD